MTYGEALEKAAKEYLQQLLNENRGNMAKCARTAGVNRTSFYRICSRHNVSFGEGRKEKTNDAIRELQAWSVEPPQ